MHRTSSLSCLAIAALALAGLPGVPASGAEPASREDLDRMFQSTLLPFLQTYCHDCHGNGKTEGMLDLSGYSSLAKVAAGHQAWATVLERLEAKEMPPEGAPQQPTPDERTAIAAWIEAVRQLRGERNAGDPGPVPARRLSNAEYDNTIRDLTGVDIRPTREFPVDPANEAGFDNSAESLAMSPALVKKYLEAARRVADHLVLQARRASPSRRTRCSPTPTATSTASSAIIDFYKRQQTDYADYFLAAWRFRHRAALGKPDATLDDLAAEAGLSPQVPGDDLGHARRDRPRRSARSPRSRRCGASCRRPTARQPDAARAGCERMRDFVVAAPPASSCRRSRT